MIKFPNRTDRYQTSYLFENYGIENLLKIENYKLKIIMYRIVKNIAVSFFILSALLSCASFAHATSYGLQEAAGGTSLIGTKDTRGAEALTERIGTIIGIGLSLLALVFFLLVLYGGIRWMVAMGKADEVTKAKEIIEQAAIGLVLVLAAYAIANFVFSRLVAIQ